MKAKPQVYAGINACVFAELMVMMFVICRIVTQSINRKTFYFICFFDTGFCCIAQAGFELKILLPQPPKYWDLTKGVCHYA
jgi:hypothetical protein